jgi:hypothetical protein
LRVVSVGLAFQAAVLAAPTVSNAAVLISADGPGNTYELIEGKGFGMELPDCGHPVRHVREVFDSTLNRNVFAMDIHVDSWLDTDRCNGSTDRQRNEVKTAPGGGDTSTLECAQGQTCYYRWKFKLDSGVQPSSSFFHIHQIKAQSGGDEGSPIFTITLRKGSPDQIQFIYTAGSGGSGSGTKAQTSLTPFKGVWVEAFVAHKASDSGFINASIKRLSDGATLISWNSGTIDTWRSGNNYNRGKWGLYRSLNDKASLRDETMLINDWCVTEASNGSDCPSGVGGGGNPTATPTPTPTPTGAPTATPTPTPTPVTGGGNTWEAESLSPVGSGASTAMQNDTSATGGTWLALLADGAGDSLTLTTPSLAAGTYSVSLRYKAHSARGILQASVDGANVGSTLDQYAATAGFMSRTFGSVTLGAGAHTLRLSCTGKNASSTAFTLSADTVTFTLTGSSTPTPTPTSGPTATPTPPTSSVSFEAEAVAVTNSGTGTTVQTDANASGGTWISLNATNTGSWMEFTSPSIPAGTYTLSMSYKTNNNRGQLSMKVDGTQVGGTLDQYQALPSVYPTASFGMVTFGSTGTHKFRLTVTGKNSASSSYVLSADKFTLQ